MATVTITDRASTTTGLDAVVTAGAGTDTHELFCSPYDNIKGWNSYGTTTGDGTLSANLTAGTYFAYVATNGTTLSPVCLVVVTTGLSSVHFRCLTAIQSRIQLLGLNNVAPASVIIRKWANTQGLDGDGAGIAYPAIVISPMGTERITPHTNHSDTVEFPCTVSICAAENLDISTNNLSDYLDYREKIAAAFRYQRLNGVPEVTSTLITPAGIVAPTNWRFGMWHSGLVIKPSAKLSRG